MLAKDKLIHILTVFWAGFFVMQVVNKIQVRQVLVSRGTVQVAKTSGLRKPSSIPRYCFNASVWNGSWDFNPNATPNAKVAQRYHSHFEWPCNMTDILRLAKSEVVTGHLNDAKEREVITRMKGLRGETVLQIGTSVDHRLLRIGCPLFGVQRHIHEAGGVVLSECVIPLINLTMAYVFNDALTKSNMPIEYQNRQLEEISTLVAKSGIQEPRFIILSGIEWDLKWFKANEEPIQWKTILQITKAKVSLFLKHFPRAKALFLRTQPFLIGKTGSLGPEESFRRYNDLFRKVARKLNPDQNICGRVHVADLEKLMLFNGTKGWSDGVHPQKWVSMQFMNILFNVISLIGEEC